MVGTTGRKLTTPSTWEQFCILRYANMKCLFDMKALAKQYVIHKKKYAESKDAEQTSSYLRMNPSSGNLRSSGSLGYKSILTPNTIHKIPNLRLKPIQSQRTTINEYESPSILSVMWKERLGILDSFDIIGSGSKSINKDQVRKDAPSSSGQPVPVGLGVCLPPLPNKSKSSSSSGQPVGLGVGLPPLPNKSKSSSSSGQPVPVSLEVGLPPLPNKSSVDLVSTFLPLFLFSFTYFSSDSVSDLLTILENMGWNPIWVKEMLGISGGCPSYDITPFFNYDSCHDVASELQEDLSNGQNSQFLRLVGLVAGSVGVGVIVLWLASNGLSS